jgi:hypothetical protein
MQDFTYTSTQTINLDAEVVISDSTSTSCSIACVIADNFLCKSFDYCPESKTCLLNSGNSVKSPLANGTIKVDSCLNFRSDYLTFILYTVFRFI